MNTKQGVTLEGLKPEIRLLLAGIELLYKRAGSELTVTCTTGGHPEDDPHTHGYAIDCRTHGLTPAKQSSLRFAIEDYLGPRYTVLLEAPGTPNEHIHIQLQKRLWRELEQIKEA
jgi:hypothetical protein